MTEQTERRIQELLDVIDYVQRVAQMNRTVSDDQTVQHALERLRSASEDVRNELKSEREAA